MKFHELSWMFMKIWGLFSSTFMNFHEFPWIFSAGNVHVLSKDRHSGVIHYVLCLFNVISLEMCLQKSAKLWSITKGSCPMLKQVLSLGWCKVVPDPQTELQVYNFWDATTLKHNFQYLHFHLFEIRHFWLHHPNRWTIILLARPIMANRDMIDLTLFGQIGEGLEPWNTVHNSTRSTQWWRNLFRYRIDLLNFSMGFNIIAPYMEFLHLNWYIAEWTGFAWHNSLAKGSSCQWRSCFKVRCLFFSLVGTTPYHTLPHHALQISV